MPPLMDFRSLTSPIAVRKVSNVCLMEANVEGSTMLGSIGIFSPFKYEPRLLTGGFITLLPHTHVTAFSRSITSSDATNNASAVPATLRTNTMFELLRDVTERMVPFNRSGDRPFTVRGGLRGPRAARAIAGEISWG